MRTRNRFEVKGILIFATLLVCTTAAYSRSDRPPGVFAVREPPNIGILQDSVKSYIKSGAYERGISKVIDSAKIFIASRYEKVGKPAIVLDIDETSLSNLKFEYKYGFGFNASLWNAWVRRASAPAIKPTLDLAKWAARRHIAIFFITGRRLLSDNLSSDPTVINLKKAGYPKWAGIFFKESRSMTTVQFKTSARRQITSEGYTILANIGDQYSDLAGGYAQGKFKLPDPMYYIP